MVSDLSEIDTAVFNALASDATLKGFCPNGVFWDVAPGATAFVLLTRTPDSDYANALGGDGWLRVTYGVKAVIKSASRVVSNNAAFRIHELLHYGLQDVIAGNYLIMLCERSFPICYGEIDPTNTAVRWQHHGGQYVVMVSPSF